jgi:diacylglycerol kinase family enzyme
MKTIYLIHNPPAGDSRHLKEDIYKIFDGKDYNVKYISTHKDNWEKFDLKNIDVICASGGDGTIHKVVDAILDRDLDKGIPIKILPLGTANNIARTLLVPLEVDSRHDGLSETPKLFDLGQIKGIKDKSFFLESVGFGIFPKLILEMQKKQAVQGNPRSKGIAQSEGFIGSRKGF